MALAEIKQLFYIKYILNNISVITDMILIHSLAKR